MTRAAARSDNLTDVRRWTTAALASDSLDTAASLASYRSIGKRDSAGAAVLALAVGLLRRAVSVARQAGLHPARSKDAEDALREAEAALPA